MLVLTRKIQQQIHVGQGITITILQVKGQAVRVGIEAPRDVRVLRGELQGTTPSEAPATPASDRPARATRPRGVVRTPAVDQPAAGSSLDNRLQPTLRMPRSADIARAVALHSRVAHRRQQVVAQG